MQDLDEWLGVNVWFTKVVNYVLNRLHFLGSNHKWPEGWSDIYASTRPPCIRKGGCQLLMIQQGRLEWKIASYWQYNKDDLSEELPVINDTSTKTTGVVVI